MSNAILSKYNRSIRPLNDIETTDAILRVLVDVPVTEQQRFWIADDANCGRVCLYSHPNFPGLVLEYVQGTQEDSMTTLFEADPVFADLPRLAEMRKELINEIGATLLALPSTVTVYDTGREREVFLNELGTAALIDTLAHFTGTDIATA